jgi:hypothetical protein
MKYNRDYELVNDILAEWDPIGVPDTVAKTEYTDYVERILVKRDNLDGIIKELETIITADIGLDYNGDNANDKGHTIEYATRIFNELKKQRLITIDELTEKIEKDDSNTDFKVAAKGMIEAINDWPTNLTTIEDFVNEMKNEFGAQITKSKLEKYSNLGEAWKMESTALAIEMLNAFPDKSFDEIVTGISDHCKRLV